MKAHMYIGKADVDLLKGLSKYEQEVDVDILNQPVYGLLPSSFDLTVTREALKRLMSRYVFKATTVHEGSTKYKHLILFVPEYVDKQSKRVVGCNVHVLSKFIKEELRYITIKIVKETRSRSENFFQKFPKESPK